MGSRVIHYCIGKEILRRVDLNENHFMLGNLAPDASNPKLGGSELSHFRIPRKLMKNECVDFNKFMSKYESEISNHFLIGYYCHLLTDNLWLKDTYKKYGHLTHEEREPIVKLIYRDYWVLNTILIDKFNLEMLDFEAPEVLPINEIEREFLSKLMENLKYDFSKQESCLTLNILDLNDILNFIEAAVTECVSSICMLRNNNLEMM